MFSESAGKLAPATSEHCDGSLLGKRPSDRPSHGRPENATAAANALLILNDFFGSFLEIRILFLSLFLLDGKMPRAA